MAAPKQPADLLTNQVQKAAGTSSPAAKLSKSDADKKKGQLGGADELGKQPPAKGLPVNEGVASGKDPSSPKPADATDSSKQIPDPKKISEPSVKKQAAAVSLSADKQQEEMKKLGSASSSSSTTTTSLSESTATSTDQVPPRKEGFTIDRLTEIGEEVLKLIAKENGMIKQRIQTLNNLTNLVLKFTESARKQTSLEPLLPELEELIKAFADISPNDFRQERRRSQSLGPAPRSLNS